MYGLGYAPRKIRGKISRPITHPAKTEEELTVEEKASNSRKRVDSAPMAGETITGSVEPQELHPAEKVAPESTKGPLFKLFEKLVK